MSKKFNESVKFVADNFRPDLFPLPSYLKPSLSKRWLTAAAVAGTLVCAAAIGIVVSRHSSESRPEPAPQEMQVQEKVTAEPQKKKIQFNDAPLPEVVKAIEEEYQVKIDGDTSTDQRLTLRYDGTAEELLEIINEQLSTKLTIKK